MAAREGCPCAGTSVIIPSSTNRLCDTVTAGEGETQEVRRTLVCGARMSHLHKEKTQPCYMPWWHCQTAQMPRLLGQARVNARKPSHMTMVNYNARDHAAPPLLPVTLPSLRLACMPPYRTFQEGPIPGSPTQSVLEGNPLYGCLPDDVSPACYDSLGKHEHMNALNCLSVCL